MQETKFFHKIFAGQLTLVTIFTWPKYLEIKMQLKFISKGGGGVGWWLKSDIPVIEDFLLGKTVNEPKTLGTTAVGSTENFLWEIPLLSTKIYLF